MSITTATQPALRSPQPHSYSHSLGLAKQASQPRTSKQAGKRFICLPSQSQSPIAGPETLNTHTKKKLPGIRTLKKMDGLFVPSFFIGMYEFQIPRGMDGTFFFVYRYYCTATVQLV